jgi:carboxypeptidase T
VDLGTMRGLADDMQRLVEGVHGRIYVPQQASQLYPTAGDTTDWVYGEYDALAITVELRPASVLDGGFILAADQIEPCWEENRPAALEFLRRALEEPKP